MPSIGAVQIQVIPGNIEYNIQKHIQWMEIAKTHGLEAIVFPEMSLTGYDRTPAVELIFSENDHRIQALVLKCQELNIHATVSVPLKINNAFYIASFHIDKSGQINVYTKTYLHGGEDVFFTPGKHNPISTIDNWNVGFAICADVSHPEHARRAGDNKVQIYLVSAFVTEEGFQKDADALSRYAAQHRFVSVFSNFCGNYGEWNAAGKSSIWSPGGNLLSQLPADEEGIACAMYDGQGWNGNIITESEII